MRRQSLTVGARFWRCLGGYLSAAMGTRRSVTAEVGGCAAGGGRVGVDGDERLVLEGWMLDGESVVLGAGCGVVNEPAGWPCALCRFGGERWVHRLDALGAQVDGWTWLGEGPWRPVLLVCGTG